MADPQWSAVYLDTGPEALSAFLIWIGIGRWSPVRDIDATSDEKCAMSEQIDVSAKGMDRAMYRPSLLELLPFQYGSRLRSVLSHPMSMPKLASCLNHVRYMTYTHLKQHILFRLQDHIVLPIFFLQYDLSFLDPTNAIRI